MRFSFVHTIRFRLTVLYSSLLFLLSGLVVGLLYVAVARSAEERPYTVQQAKLYSVDTERYIGKAPVVELAEVENAVNLLTLKTMRDYSLLTLGGLFVASFGIGWVLSGRVLRPVRSITRAAAEIQGTDLSRRILLTGPKDELRDLADTVDTMLGRLEGAFLAQRQLIDDASHELRSPLAIIRANVDAVLASPDSTEEERMRAVAIVDRATTRMTRLVEDLLATARRSAPALADAEVDVGTLAAEAAEEFTALAAGRGLTIRKALPSGLRGVGDHDALRRAVGNLLSNAVRLAPAGSEVVVAAGRSDDWIWVAVRDAGPGVSEDDHARVFDRFWRGKSGGETSETGGGTGGGTGRRDRHSGLGLAIVRQIVESHGGHVRLFSRPGQGSVFVLWLPAGNGPAEGEVPDLNPLADAAPITRQGRRERA